MTGRLRVLVLNLRDRGNPHAGGAEEHLHKLFGNLAARGHDVTLFCGSFPGASRRAELDGIKIVRRGGRFTTTMWSILYYLRNQTRFDVIVDYTCQLHFLTPLYVRLPRLAVALHVVGEVYTNDLPWPAGHLLAWWESFSLRRFYGRERFIALSNSTAEDLQGHGIHSSQIRVIHVGRIDPPPLGARPSLTPGLLYLGRLRRYKRVDWILRAMPEIVRARPDAHLHIVGSGDQAKNLEKLARRLGIDDHVTFHGWLPEDAKWKIIRSCWLSIQPSMKEGWGMTVMEAAACGVPSLAANVPGLRDAVLPGHSGELFDPERPGEITRIAIELLGDDERRAQLGLGALEWARSFSWEESAKQLEEMLHETVAATDAQVVVAEHAAR